MLHLCTHARQCSAPSRRTRPPCTARTPCHAPAVHAQIEDADDVERFLALLVQLAAQSAELRTCVNAPRHVLPFLQPGRLVRVMPEAYEAKVRGACARAWKCACPWGDCVCARGGCMRSYSYCVCCPMPPPAPLRLCRRRSHCRSLVPLSGCPPPMAWRKRT